MKRARTVSASSSFSPLRTPRRTYQAPLNGLDEVPLLLLLQRLELLHQLIIRQDLDRSREGNVSQRWDMGEQES